MLFMTWILVSIGLVATALQARVHSARLNGETGRTDTQRRLLESALTAFPASAQPHLDCRTGYARPIFGDAAAGHRITRVINEHMESTLQTPDSTGCRAEFSKHSMLDMALTPHQLHPCLEEARKASPLLSSPRLMEAEGERRNKAASIHPGEAQPRRAFEKPSPAPGPPSASMRAAVVEPDAEMPFRTPAGKRVNTDLKHSWHSLPK
jgi:hypothetical protein